VIEAESDPPLWRPAPLLAVLRPGETHVFALQLAVPDPRVAQLEELLSLDERSRAERFHQSWDRRRYIVARAQLRTILARYAGQAAHEIEFYYGAHGKPRLAGGDSQPIGFNLSRSHELGLLAIQLDSEIGVDLERIRPFPDGLAVAQRLFAPDEYKLLSSLPVAVREAAFFSYWTRKEAIVKSLGGGLSHPIDGFTLTPAREAVAEPVMVPSGSQCVTRWVTILPQPSVGYLAALATAAAPNGLRCWSWPG
jgi:4'-phosphopantetheinyl transferase